MTQDQEISEGRAARAFLDDALVKRARAHIEERLAGMRRAVAVSDTDMHTRLIVMEQLATMFFEFFEKASQTGELAQLQVRREEAKRSLFERGVAQFQRFGR